MKKLFSGKAKIILGILLCGVVLILFICLERYDITTTAQSIENEDEVVNIELECTILNDLMSNRIKCYGDVKVKLPYGQEITYEISSLEATPLQRRANHVPEDSKDIYLLNIAGLEGVPSAEHGMTTPSGFLFFEEDMDTFAIWLSHPDYGIFVGAKDGEVSDEITQKYAGILMIEMALDKAGGNEDDG